VLHEIGDERGALAHFGKSVELNPDLDIRSQNFNPYLYEAIYFHDNDRITEKIYSPKKKRGIKVSKTKVF
jgi:hypothetical protein